MRYSLMSTSHLTAGNHQGLHINNKTVLTSLLVTEVIQSTYRAARTHFATLGTKTISARSTVVASATHHVGLAVTLTTQGAADAAPAPSAITLASCRSMIL